MTRTRLAAWLCTGVLALGACAPIDDAVDAYRLLRDLESSAAGAPPAATPGPRVIAWTHRGETLAADLYRWREPLAALVLMPGLGRDGRRDPRVVAFAQALARARFAVMVPDVPNFQAQRVSAGDAELVAD